MKAYETPENLVKLLNRVVRSAARTAFYKPRLGGISSISTLSEFGTIPPSSFSEFRTVNLRDILTEPEKIDWIVGASAGQSPEFAALTESGDEGNIRYDLLTDAVKEHVSLDQSTVCVVVSTPERRYFASEIATILIAAGARAHVFTDAGGPRTYERIDILSPTILVMLSKGLSEEELPKTVKLCITVNGEHHLARFPQLDIYHVDGLGFLGHSTNLETYTLNSDVFYFEQSDDHTLIVTPLYVHVRPAIRIELEDTVEMFSPSRLRFRQTN